MAAVKIGVSRQVVIPKKIHDTLGLAPGRLPRGRGRAGQGSHDTQGARGQAAREAARGEF